MTTKPKQIAEPIKVRSTAPALFPECAEYRLALSDQVEIAFLDNHRASPHPPLVLLHGIFDNKATWTRLAAQLTGYRLIAPDLVGHGFSSKPTFGAQPVDQRYAPDMQVEFLDAFIAALELDEMILVGNSLGGGLALRLYLRFPELAEKVRGLVLLAAAGYPQKLPGHLREFGGWPGRLLTLAPVRALAHGSGLLRLAARHTFRRCFHDRKKIPPALIDTTLAVLQTPNILYVYHYSARNIAPPVSKRGASHSAAAPRAEFHQRFAEITCPTLVIWGQQDRILHPHSAQRFAADIPNAQLHLLEDCGHAPHLEYPDVVAQHITHWLGDHP